MTFNGWFQIALFCAIIILLVKPFGGYITRVFAGERTLLSPVLGPVERGFYRLGGVDERSEQNWVSYAVSMLLFSLVGFASQISVHLGPFLACISIKNHTHGRACRAQSIGVGVVPDSQPSLAELFGGRARQVTQRCRVAHVVQAACGAALLPPQRRAQ